MILAIDMSHVAFIMLRYGPSIQRFLSFYHEIVLNLIKGFQESVKMNKWFLSLFLLMCCIAI
jgi:hypothetical protein